MIKIEIREKNNLVDEIIIKGHSGYEETGRDIVCASVSSITITTVNAIIKIDNNSITYQEKDGYLDIKILKHDKYIDILISNMLDLLKELEKQYEEYIRIL